MGLWDFLNKKKEDSLQPDTNGLFLENLKTRIEEQGHSVEYSTEYAAITVNSQVEIATKIAEGEFHPSLLPMMVLTMNDPFFPNGINSSLAGIGDTVEEKIDSAVSNYISNFFFPIIESFTDTHMPEFDFESNSSGKVILWHPKMSDNLLQGA